MSTTTIAQPLCAARKRNGDPCAKRAARGLTTCKQHADPSINNAHRPSLFTAERQSKVLKAIKAGATRKDAATLGGVAYDTLREWIYRGRKADEAGQPEDDYAVFSAAVEIAEAEHKMLLIGSITHAAISDWKAALALLERKYPGEYVRRTVNLSGELPESSVAELLQGQQPFQVSVEKRERIIALLQEGEPEGPVTDAEVVER